jgi:hypothetical protein
MEKLKKMVQDNPKLKSDKSEYLKLAVKEAKGGVKGTGPHSVKLLGCERTTNRDYQTQKEVKGVNLLFEEAGESKKYFVPILSDDGKFHYLIERFAEIEEGTELVLEYKRKEGSFRGYIDVQLADEDQEEKVGEKGIPVIEEDETFEGDYSEGYDPEV